MKEKNGEKFETKSKQKAKDEKSFMLILNVKLMHLCCVWTGDTRHGPTLINQEYFSMRQSETCRGQSVGRYYHHQPLSGHLTLGPTTICQNT